MYIAYDVWYDVKWCDVILQYIFNVAWVTINFKDHDGDKKHNKLQNNVRVW